MKVLVDNCLPVGIRVHIAGHEVETAYHRGWGSLENSDLVHAAVDAGFDVLLSIDQGQEFRTAVQDQPIAVVLFPGRQGSRLADLLPLVPRLLAAIEKARNGEVTVV